MSLDAVVYCNCYKTGKLKEPPPYPELISINYDGSVTYKHDDLNVEMEIDKWLYTRACEHENGVFIHHRIGNITRIANLRENLSIETDKFPIILNKVIYNGSHCGDFLTLEEIKTLEKEIKRLNDLDFSDEISQERVNYFKQQLKELTKAALEMKNPIVF